jgi:hypothetical protein
MPRPLGKNQKGVLQSLRDHGSWHTGAGWYWDTFANTERILDSLVKRGLVVRTIETPVPGGWVRPVYRPAKVD